MSSATHINTLKSVFWDYPRLTDEAQLLLVIEEARSTGDKRLLFLDAWLNIPF